MRHLRMCVGNSELTGLQPRVAAEARARPDRRGNDPATGPGLAPPMTPDGRYIVVRGRLWRRADPGLDADRLAELVAELMSARRGVGAALRGRDADALAAARARVNAAKVALGERGPVWWTDGAPDQNRRLARNTAYADWYRSLEGAS